MRRIAGAAVSAQASDYLTTAEVAERYRTRDSTVRHWRSMGYGPKGVKVGRRMLYPQSEIDRFDAELADRIGNGVA